MLENRLNTKKENRIKVLEKVKGSENCYTIKLLDLFILKFDNVKILSCMCL